jgi:hypothetical protein
VSKKHYQPLEVPPVAREQGGVELLRAAIVGQGLAMSARRGFDDPRAWGVLLGAAARHVARLYGEETSTGEGVALAQIAAAFAAETADEKTSVMKAFPGTPAS